MKHGLMNNSPAARSQIRLMDIQYGVYQCVRCGKTYTVNDPGSWRLCTPEFCHDCLEHLNAQWFVEPLNPERPH